MNEYPDHNHIEQLSKYLWQWPQSRASVMVGAGISRNATPLKGDQNSFPAWNELSQMMFRELYPDTPIGESNSKNATRIASEYASKYKEAGLEDFLRRSIPNDSHKPGEIHELLLGLPWNDVYTTNYDTLLERTGVAGRTYSHVIETTDLKNAVPPRIVKLHGTFPCQTPFIITESHYLHYERDFALFVNTFRQSMIVNTIVLLGFSGDDPNFLQWNKWIQDHSDSRNLPIYMISTSPLTDVERSYLVGRGVTPIDLSLVFDGAESSSEAHAKRLKSFLNRLWDDKPARPERWPHSASSTSNRASDQLSTLEVFHRWRSERIEYPGWVVPTNDTRRELLADLNRNYSGVLKSMVDWTPVEMALVLREILWRFGISMLPLDSSLVNPLNSIVENLLPVIRGGAPVEQSIRFGTMFEISHLEVSEAWAEIAFSLLRDAREACDSDRWDEVNEMIESVPSEQPSFVDRHKYEQALWHMWNLERDRTMELLGTWNPAIHSSQATMWRAGLLMEQEQWDEAYSLLNRLLTAIRTSLSHSIEQDIELLSCEGWCMLFLHYYNSINLALMTAQGFHAPQNVTAVPPTDHSFLDRWDELKKWECDPWPIIEHFDKVLTETPPVSKTGRRTTYGFDPGHQTISHSFGLSPNTQWIPAFSYLRMFEKVGLPLRLSNDTLQNVPEWLAPHVKFWSPLLLIRAGKTTAFAKLKSVTRTRIAYLDNSQALRLYRWAMDALRREMSNITDQIPFESYQTSLIESLVELLSRLSIKLQRDELNESFFQALELHNLPQFYSHIRLHKACQPWFKRLFEAADDNQLLSWLPELLRFPYTRISEQAFDPDIFNWPDPALDFEISRTMLSTESFSKKVSAIRESIDQLLRSARDETNEGRQRPLKRLIRVLELLSTAQQQELGSLLWEHTNANGLPDLIDVYSFVYLHIPAPTGIDALSNVKKYLLTLVPRNSFSSDANANQFSFDLSPSDNMLYEVSHCTKQFIQIPHEFDGKNEWDKEEARLLWERVYDWWENDRNALAFEGPSMSWGADYLLSKFEGLDLFLRRVVLPYVKFENQEEVGKLLAFLSETRQHHIFLTTSLPYLLLHPFGKQDEVQQTIMSDLSSEQEMAVSKGSSAVRHWLHLSNKNHVNHPPNDVLTKLIRRVAFQQQPGAVPCLQNLSLLLLEIPHAFCQNDVELIVSSLEPWNDLTRLPMSQTGGGFPEEERPLLRSCLGSLASSLSRWLREHNENYTEPKEIAFLRDQYCSDSLPEVRRSFDHP